MFVKDIKRSINNGSISKSVSKMIGGGGGGRPNSAQAGGKDNSKLEEAVKTIPNLISAAIKTQ